MADEGERLAEVQAAEVGAQMSIFKANLEAFASCAR
jgi:hypothetical protein